MEIKAHGIIKILAAFAVFTIVYLKTSVAQTDSLYRSILQTELNFHVGKLIKIHGEYPPNDITTLTELNISWKLTGKRYWHKLYHYPSAGFSFIHAQFGNQDVLEQSYGFIPTMRYEKWKNETRWAVRVGLGLAYFTKPYHSQNNPENLVVGSPVANMSLLKVEMSRPLGRMLRYNVGLSIMHSSNAHVDVPNIGANLIALSAGLSFCNQPALLNPPLGKEKVPRIKSPWNPGVQTMLGIHEFKGTIRPVDGPKYFVYGASVFATKHFKAKGKMSLGLNYHYYTAYHDYALSQELFKADDNIRKKSQNLVLFAGYEWNYGRFALFIQGGINLYNPFLQEINKVWDLPKSRFINLWTANKIGYKIYAFSQNGKPFSKVTLFNPYLSTAVKTNGGTADFLELAVGVELGNNRKGRK